MVERRMVSRNGPASDDADPFLESVPCLPNFIISEIKISKPCNSLETEFEAEFETEFETMSYRERHAVKLIHASDTTTHHHHPPLTLTDIELKNTSLKF